MTDAANPPAILIDTLPHQPMADAIMPIMEAGFDKRFGEAWNRKQLVSMLTMPHANAVLAFPNTTTDPASAPDPETASGFALYRTVGDECEIMLIAVHPKARRQGVGGALIRHIMDHGLAGDKGRVFLEMRRNNPAVRLYTSLGFQKIGERPRYYTGIMGEKFDALTLAVEKNRR